MQKKIHILIVDDQESLRETLGDILKDRGYLVELARDGYEAIQKAKDGKFTIVFMDVVMPGINGLDTFREIKKVKPRTAFIMMSAYAQANLVKAAMAEGAYVELSKPFDLDEIFKIIEEIGKQPAFPD